MYKTKKKGREGEMGSVCVHVHVYYKRAGRERVKLDIYTERRNPWEGVCLVHRVMCPTRERWQR